MAHALMLALQKQPVQQVLVRDVYQLYPDFKIDVAEQQHLRQLI